MKRGKERERGICSERKVEWAEGERERETEGEKIRER